MRRKAMNKSRIEKLATSEEKFIVEYVEILGSCLSGELHFCGPESHKGQDIAKLFTDYQEVSETIDPDVVLTEDTYRDLNKRMNKNSAVTGSSDFRYHNVVLSFLDDIYKVDVEGKKVFTVDSVKKFDEDLRAYHKD